MIRVLVAVFALIFISSSSVFAQQPSLRANKIQLRHSRPANTPRSSDGDPCGHADSVEACDRRSRPKARNLATLFMRRRCFPWC